MPSNLMEELKLAAKWLQIEGVEGVSANEEKECIDVFVSESFDITSNSIPKEYNGIKILIFQSK